MFHITSFEEIKNCSKKIKKTNKKTSDHVDLRMPKYIEMKILYQKGYSLAEIGDKFSFSREYIRQILKKYFNITGIDGGVSLRAIVNMANKKHLILERKKKKIAENLECTYEYFLAVNGGKNLTSRGSPAQLYFQQKKNSALRNIEWNLTFKQWYEIWIASGKYNSRGRGNGYVMARIGDTGKYEQNNVEIITARQNASDSFIKHPQSERIEKARLKKLNNQCNFVVE